MRKFIQSACFSQTIKCSDRSNVPHPIRLFVDRDVVFPKNHKLPHISLALGEPVKANGFLMPPKAKQAVINAIQSEDFNGYTPSFGTPAARLAVAKKFGNSDYPLAMSDVFMTVGSYSALYLTFMTLCNKGDNILEPEPGFPMTSNAHNLGYSTRYFKLRPEKDWEVDLEDMEKKITKKTKAILLNNPSNPCGSVWSKNHLLDIIKVAMKKDIPIVSDEAYHSIAFGDQQFHSIGHQTKKHPIICTGSMSKMYCIPGWRVGWGLVYDYEGRLDEFRKNIYMATSLTLHPPSIVQAAIPAFFEESDEFLMQYNKKLGRCYENFYNNFTKINGLVPMKAYGSIYMMVKLDFTKFKNIKDDKEFSLKLLAEKNLFVMPASLLRMYGFIRVLLCCSDENQKEVLRRLTEFCNDNKA